VLDSVSMDNPQLVAYIRQVHLKSTNHQDPLNANQTSEEKYVATLSQNKREGIYAEYISRVRNLSFYKLPESMINVPRPPLRALRASSFQCDGVNISLFAKLATNGEEWMICIARQVLKFLITDRILDQFPGDLSLIKKFEHRQFSKDKGLQMMKFPQVPVIK